MSSKKIIVAAAAGLFGFAAAALAQTISVPQVQKINQNDLIQVVPNGKPSAQSVYATPAQINSQMGYQVASPATGFTYKFGNSDSQIVLTHSATIASGTVTLAAAPSDGAEECLYAQNQVTSLVVAKGDSAQTLNNAVTTIAALAKVCYLYTLSTNTWNRSK